MVAFGKMLPLLPMFGPFKLPTTNGHLGPPLRTNGKASQKIETFWLTHCLPGGMAKAIPYKRLAPFHYKATPLQTSRTTLVLRRRGGPMCPPGRNTCRFPWPRANAYHLGFRKNGTFWEDITFATHVCPIPTAHHGRTLRSAPTHRRVGYFFILLQYFYKYKGQTCENFLHTPTK